MTLTPFGVGFTRLLVQGRRKPQKQIKGVLSTLFLYVLIYREILGKTIFIKNY